MRPNTVKRKLARGGTALGAFIIEFNSASLSRLLAAAGAEFAVFDMEHTGWSVETIQRLILGSYGTDLVPIVRVPALQHELISRPLDVGAMGIMVPMVESGEQARFLVECAKYPPKGRRGAAFGLVHDDYDTRDVVHTMASANDEVLLIAQIETAAGLAHVDEIAATDGIDVLWVGHSDLTNSLGIPFSFEHPLYVRALTDVLAACARRGKIGGFGPPDVETAQKLVAQGFRCVTVSADGAMYTRALREGLARVRASIRDESVV